MTKEENRKSLPERIKTRLLNKKIPARLVFIVTGIVATIWFLVRVIPKPTRATYPCMQVAAPLMSSLVIYVLSITGSFLAFKKAKTHLFKAKYLAAAGFLVVAIITSIFAITNNNNNTYAGTAEMQAATYPANQPMGEGIGIFPGRVVWAYDADATNENYDLDVVNNWWDDGWWLPANTDQTVVNEMFDASIKALSGESTITDAWDAIFKDFNDRRGKGNVGYTAGETIFIKINQGWGGWASDPANEFDFKNVNWVKDGPGTVETTPQTVLALLNQLIDEHGIPQANIYVGDPIAHLFKHTYDALHDVYPNVKYFDKDYNTYGRTKTTGQTSAEIFYSDDGSVMTDASYDKLYNEFYDADYIINTSALKAHKIAGVTLIAKNHFGTQYNDNKPGSAEHLHDGLICADVVDEPKEGRDEYGVYRVLVDLLGHEHMGQKTVLNIIDGLWGAPAEVEANPVKWQMAPFNDDFPSSIFISQDPIALESVCFDFLRTEAALNEEDFKNRPLWVGVDDHLHQAADSDNWPSGITYNPDGSGAIGSLGVHEHWNNSTDKQYKKNLNINDTSGIHLVTVPEDFEETFTPEINTVKEKAQFYPNPTKDWLTIRLNNNSKGRILVSIHDLAGKELNTFVLDKSTELFEETIDIRGLDDNVYIINIHHQDFSISEKISKIE